MSVNKTYCQKRIGNSADTVKPHTIIYCWNIKHHHIFKPVLISPLTDCFLLEEHITID